MAPAAEHDQSAAVCDQTGTGLGRRIDASGQRSVPLTCAQIKAPQIVKGGRRGAAAAEHVHVVVVHDRRVRKARGNAGRPRPCGQQIVRLDQRIVVANGRRVVIASVRSPAEGSGVAEAAHQTEVREAADAFNRYG